MTNLDLLDNFAKISKLNELSWDIHNKNSPSF